MSSHPYYHKQQAPDDETEPPPGRWHLLPRELWSLILAQLNRRSLRAASLICRVAHQEADPYLFKQIIWKRWRNRHVLALHYVLQQSKQRARMVQRLTIRSVEGHVSADAARALVGVLRMATNLKTLQLNVFTQTTMENVLQFEPLLELFAAGCPFQLHTFITDAPFETRIVQFLDQQIELTRLEWDTARIGRPAPVLPPRALARLKYLRSSLGWRQFVSNTARSLTHLCVDLPPQAQLDELLVVFSDRLISLKLVERRRAARPVPFRPAVAFRRGLPRTLRWLEVRELPSANRGDDGSSPLDENLEEADTFPFSEEGLALRVFVWQAAWMSPASLESCVEALRFADRLSDARVSMRFFVFFGDGDGDEDAVTVWDLYERACVHGLERLPENCWLDPY